MPANHQTLKYAQKVPTSGVVGTHNFAIEVPSSLIFRRLYLGAHMWTGMTNILWTAKIEFLTQGKADGFPLEFGWRSQSYGIPGNGQLGYALNPVFPVCPPFSVESIPTGSASDFVSAAPAQQDEMIATTRDEQMTQVRNVRMLPIPLAVRCEQIKATFAYYTDATAASYQYFEMFLGCRSSDYAL